MAQQSILTQFTCNAFAPHIGESFSAITFEGVTVPLELIEATPAKLQPNDGRVLGKAGFVRHDPFALLFRGPREAFLLQGIYTFTHDTMGAFEMSIVPVGPGDTGWLYEAVYN